MLTRCGFIRWRLRLLFSPTFCSRQESGFFQGKTVRIIVGTSPGGGFDVYSRTLARHMGKYTAGNPNFIVENMPGAGPSNRRQSRL